MIFNSHVFLIFFVVVLGMHWVVPDRHRNVVLIVASYFFYGWWDWRFLFLLMASTLIDFSLARAMAATDVERRRKALLLTSVSANLGFLGFFKYFNFFVDSFESLVQSVGLDASGPTLDVVLPVGISFYTFQTISYSFDVYRRHIAPTERLLDFATYVAYFPQLVAGPIERARELLPRIENQARRSFPQGRDLERALSLVLIGLFKKVVIADGVASIVDEVFTGPNEYSAIAVAAGILGFGIQIYGDFSGYTDMARGISELLGIDLVVNFREPYLSRNITEFWRRWHISLSNWLRDYLYIPLGGNRGSGFATARNLMVTMLLGGLWHGASWNFVIWGGLHGAYLAVHRWLFGGTAATGAVTVGDIPRIVATFVIVNATWVFFRADSLQASVDVLQGLGRFTSGAVDYADVGLVATMLLLALAVDLGQRRAEERRLAGVESVALPSAVLGAAGVAMIAAIVMFSGGSPKPFIYFQF